MPLPTVAYAPERVEPAEVVARLRRELDVASARRSVRQFSTEPVPREAIELAIATAGTAPSGAHRQPWQFVAISDPALKARIREEAEAEERAFYAERATPEWLAALEPLGTDDVKEHITDAPWLIVVFRRDADVVDGARRKNYYVAESTGIAVGMLIAALHRAGLATLPHTPSPMQFLRELCGRPAEEKPFLLMPVGYPAAGCRVPDLHRKPLDAIASFLAPSGVAVAG
jgi:nitroreductase